MVEGWVGVSTASVGAELFWKGFAGLPAKRQVPGWQNWQIVFGRLL